MVLNQLKSVMKNKALLICLFSLLFIPYTVQAKNFPITWDTEKIEQTIALGDSIDVTATFTSKNDMQNVDLWVVQDLQPYVSIEPNHFDMNSKNTPIEVTLHISAASEVPTWHYDGTIHLRVGSRTYPQTLKIKINIVDLAETVGPEGGVVEVSDAGSELYRTKIEIPAGALNDDTVISLTLMGIPSDLPEGTTNGGIFVELGPDGIEFNTNIQVTIPYDDIDNDGIVDYSDVPEENLSVVTWDSNTQQWISMPIIGQDTKNNNITFETNHFSICTTLFGCSSYSEDVFIFSIDGLDFTKSFLKPFKYSEIGYLRNGLLEMGEMGLGLKKNAMCILFLGAEMHGPLH